MGKITPFLWLDQGAEEALQFYTAIFKNSQAGEIRGKGDGSILTASFELEGQTLTLLNGGPYYKLTPAVSLFIDCLDQGEVDYYWGRLLEGGGEPLQCGWLTDRFGISWQVVPRDLGRLLGDPDQEASARVMQAMLRMVKLEVAQLEAAFRGDG